MNAEIICIGTELLLGHTINTNCAAMARLLAECGIDCYRIVTVGDNPQRMKSAIKRALADSDIVLTCGGLGPTEDDITYEVIARATGKKLKYYPAIKRRIDEYIKHRKKSFKTENVYKSALMPAGCATFPNRVGTAAGISLKYKRKHIIALPGPPDELKSLLYPSIKNYLLKLTPKRTRLISRSIKLFGIPEPLVNEKITHLLADSGTVKAGIYVHQGEVTVRLMAKAKTRAKARSLMRPAEKFIHQTFGDYIFGYDEDTLVDVCQKILMKKHLTVAVAESCTAGGLAHMITSVANSSRIFRGGFITYSNDIKRALLGVKKETIKKYGAVSSQTAKEMAANARKKCQADIGISITGIAGPGGGSNRKPVGTVYIALANGRETDVYHYIFRGNRTTIRLRSAKTALDFLRRKLVLQTLNSK